MRNTNNGQTSDFTDFVRAVTRNRDTTWRGLMSSNGFLHVRLVEESNNPHDSNAILVVSYYSGKIVGHLERAVAGSISQLIMKALTC